MSAAVCGKVELVKFFSDGEGGNAAVGPLHESDLVGEKPHAFRKPGLAAVPRRVAAGRAADPAPFVIDEVDAVGNPVLVTGDDKAPPMLAAILGLHHVAAGLVARGLIGDDGGVADPGAGKGQLPVVVAGTIAVEHRAPGFPAVGGL